MGGCATKPKVEGENAPAPVKEDEEKGAVADEAAREIVQAGEEEEEKKSEAVNRRPSLGNLLDEDDQLTESAEHELKSESIKQEQILKLDEATQVVVPSGIETSPKPSEVTKTEDDTPVVLNSETLNPTAVIVTNKVAAPVVPNSETPNLSEVTKTEVSASIAPNSETHKPSEITKTEDAPSKVPSEPKKEETSATTLSETKIPKTTESVETNVVPAETKNIVEAKEYPPLKIVQDEETKPESTDKKPLVSESSNP